MYRTIITIQRGNALCFYTRRSAFISSESVLRMLSTFEKKKTPIRITQTEYQKTSLGENDARQKSTHYLAQDNKIIRVENERDQNEKVEISMQEAINYCSGKLADLLLPKGYPDSVHSGYLRYVTFQGAGMVFGSAAGVLSTQSLLYAMGLGAGALPLAATLNWVIKDGVGMAGGIAFASLVNTRFDADPRFWRLAAAGLNDAACYLEMLAPLAPGAFLPVACAANVGKNVGFLAASASRAGLHAALAARGNLADLTAKAGSQALLASLAGTALGVSVSTAVGENWGAAFTALACLSAAHLTCQVLSVQGVALTTLNLDRLEAVVRHFRETGEVPGPAEVGARAPLVPPSFWPGAHRPVRVGTPLREMFNGAPQALVQQLRPTAPRQRGEGGGGGERAALVAAEGGGGRGARAFLIAAAGGGRGGGGDGGGAHVVFREGCTSWEVLEGATYAMCLGTLPQERMQTVAVNGFPLKGVEGDSEGANVLGGKEWEGEAQAVLGQLGPRGWNTETLFLEDSQIRYTIVEGSEDGNSC